MDGQVGDPAVGADLHILGEPGSAVQCGGAHHGDIGAGSDVLVIDSLHVQVEGRVAPAHDDIVLTDVLQIPGHTGQGLHVAAVLAVALLTVAEGGQNPQTAVLAAQIPVLAGAQVVQKGLVALMDDDAHVGDAGVDIVGQHEVDQTIPAAEGQRTGVARASQLAQISVGAVGKENTVEIIHARSPPFTSSRIMALGEITAFSPTVTPLATTAMPHSGLSSGAEPTTASDSTTAFSATMA